MNSKCELLNRILFAVLLLSATLFVTSSEVLAQSDNVKVLAVNKDFYVGRVSLQKAKARRVRTFSNAAADHLIEPFAQMVKEAFGAELTDFQFRYHIGRKAVVIRGRRTAKGTTAYAYRDGEFDFSEWGNIPSALTGPFVALPKKDVDRLSDRNTLSACSARR